MTLREKLKYGYLHEALEEMLKLTQKTHFYDDCMLQSSAFHRIERDLEKGLIHYQDADLTKNRINNVLLSILEKYEREFGQIPNTYQNFSSENFDSLPKNTNIGKQNLKNDLKMDLKDFKDSLKNLVDEGKLSEVFEEIEENSQVSYEKSQFNSLRNRVIDGENSTAFKQQIKAFIGTLKFTAK